MGRVEAENVPPPPPPPSPPPMIVAEAQRVGEVEGVPVPPPPTPPNPEDTEGEREEVGHWEAVREEVPHREGETEGEAERAEETLTVRVGGKVAMGDPLSVRVGESVREGVEERDPPTPAPIPPPPELAVKLCVGLLLNEGKLERVPETVVHTVGVREVVKEAEEENTPLPEREEEGERVTEVEDVEDPPPPLSPPNPPTPLPDEAEGVGVNWDAVGVPLPPPREAV